jgi:hypothetical protein
MSLIKAKKFIRNLMMNLEKYRFRFLKKKHYDFLKDKATIFVDPNTINL